MTNVLHQFNRAAGQQRLALVGAVVISAFAIYEASLAVRLWQVLPCWDQWAAVEFYRKWTTSQQSLLHLLFMQHNEHRLLLTRLGFLADFAFFQGRSTFVFPLLLFAHITLGVALGLLATRGRQGAERALAAAFCTAIMVSPLQMDNLVLPFHLQWVACGLFSLAAISCTAQLEETTRARTALVALAVISVFASVYSSANGIATALIVLAMVSVLRMTPIHQIVVAAAAIFSIATFFIGYVFPAHHRQLAASVGSVDEIRQFFFFIGAFLGSFAQRCGLGPSILIGLLGICAWLGLVIVFAIRWRATKPIDSSGVAMLMLAAVALATATMTALGRSGLGAEHAMISRYATWALLFWLSLIAAADRMMAIGRWSKVVMLGASAILLVLSSLSAKGTLGFARHRAHMLEDMTAQLRSGIVPQHLQLIYPNGDPSSVLSWLEFLRQHKLSVFADGAPAFPLQPGGS